MNQYIFCDYSLRWVKNVDWAPWCNASCFNHIKGKLRKTSSLLGYPIILYIFNVWYIILMLIGFYLPLFNSFCLSFLGNHHRLFKRCHFLHLHKWWVSSFSECENPIAFALGNVIVCDCACKIHYYWVDASPIYREAGWNFKNTLKNMMGNSLTVSL